MQQLKHIIFQDLLNEPRIMIWYDMILFAQNRGPKAELQCTI